MRFISRSDIYNTLVNVSVLLLNNCITIFFIVFICNILPSATSTVENVFCMFLNKLRSLKTCMITFESIIQIVSIMTVFSKLIVILSKTRTMFEIFIMFINDLEICWFLLLLQLLFLLQILFFKFLSSFHDLRDLLQQCHSWFTLSQRSHFVLS